MNCFIFAGQRIGPGLPSTSPQWQEAVIKFSAKFKLLNQDSDKLWHHLEILIHEVYPSGKQTTAHFHDL